MRGANVFHLGVKEFRSLRRDPVMLVLIAYAFTVAIHTAATAIPEVLNRATVAIVDEDRSPLSLRIVSAFRAPYFVAPELVDHAQMDARLDAGRATFAIDIPPDFQRDVLAGRAPAVQLNVDATRMSQAFAGTRDIQQIVLGEVADFVHHHRAIVTPPVDLALRARFNPELDKSWFGGIMEVINNVTMLSLVLTGAALIREREHGTVEHLLAMPVTPAEIMLSKIWAMGVVVLLASLFALTVVVERLLEVPIEGSMTLFLVGSAVHLFATASLGIFLATIARSMPQFGLLMMLVLLPLQVLSGAVTPRESMPDAVRYLMLAAPNTHFVAFAQSVLYRGAGIDVVWPHLLGIGAIGATLYAVALRRFRGTIHKMA